VSTVRQPRGSTPEPPRTPPEERSTRVESRQARRLRAHAILDRLAAVYPDAHCELRYSTPLELLIATILSAQCSDVQVNKTTPALFEACKSAKDYAETPVERLEQSIRRIGLFRNKARNIQACCRALVLHHGGEVPRDLESLTQLAGVGRKTANVVLGNAFGITSGFVVDTHVGRLSARLGLSSARTPEGVERDLMAGIDRERWILASHLLIWHGRRRCTARSPDCAGCELGSLCPSRGRV
jgi:endonuclease III